MAISNKKTVVLWNVGCGEKPYNAMKEMWESARRNGIMKFKATLFLLTLNSLMLIDHQICVSFLNEHNLIYSFYYFASHSAKSVGNESYEFVAFFFSFSNEKKMDQLMKLFVYCWCHISGNNDHQNVLRNIDD